MNGILQRWIERRFNALYYRDRTETWRNTFWMGVPILKCPMDLWIYQELLHAERPDLIVETGTHSGGSGLYLASLCDLLDHGAVVSVDVAPRDNLPVHERLTYIRGSSTDPAIVKQVHERAAGGKTLVILDSDHSRKHVLAELDAYSSLTPIGHHLIVEDTNLNGNPVRPNYGPGPMEAVEDFLAGNPGFEIDSSMEKFKVTFNPNGFLKRTPDTAVVRRNEAASLRLQRNR